MVELRSISGSHIGYLIFSLPFFMKAREANFTVPYTVEQKDAHELNGGDFSWLLGPNLYD